MTVQEKYQVIHEVLMGGTITELQRNELIDFVDKKAEGEVAARERAKAKRLEKNGGVKKDVTESDYYVSLRNALYKVLTTEPKTCDQLLADSKYVNASGKKIIAPQVGIALKPLLADGTVVETNIIVTITGKDGLKKETSRKAFKLA